MTLTRSLSLSLSPPFPSRRLQTPASTQFIATGAADQPPLLHSPGQQAELQTHYAPNIFIPRMPHEGAENGAVSDCHVANCNGDNTGVGGQAGVNETVVDYGVGAGDGCGGGGEHASYNVQGGGIGAALQQQQFHHHEVLRDGQERGPPEKHLDVDVNSSSHCVRHETQTDGVVGGVVGVAGGGNCNSGVGLQGVAQGLGDGEQVGLHSVSTGIAGLAAVEELGVERRAPTQHSCVDAAGYVDIQGLNQSQNIAASAVHSQHQHQQQEQQPDTGIIGPTEEAHAGGCSGCGGRSGACYCENLEFEVVTEIRLAGHTKRARVSLPSPTVELQEGCSSRDTAVVRSIAENESEGLHAVEEQGLL